MTLLNDSEVEQRLAGARDWHAGEGRTIVRELGFANFADAMTFVNRVAEAAEETVGLQLGNLTPAVLAVLEMLLDRFGRGTVELAQAISP